jgi:hypothetical protein
MAINPNPTAHVWRRRKKSASPRRGSRSAEMALVL